MPTSTRKPGTGTTSTTRYSGDSATSGNAWSNPGNILVEGDSNNATNTGGTGQGRYLIGSNFGFSSVIQTGATINSITGRYKRAKTSGTPTEAGCVLVGPSGLVSSEMNDSSAYPATTLTDRTFTATFTGTVADIRDTAFGLSIKQTGTGIVQVDVMELTIDYTNPPVLTTTGSALAYTENDSATAIDTGLTATADTTNLTGATVSITTGFQSAEDTLAFSTQNGISGSYNSGTGVMTLSGTATVANYQTALRSVTYVNSSENPDTTTRVITFQATDSGSRDSVAVTRSITITRVNDAPVVTCSGGNLSFTEGDSATVVDSGITVSDVDTLNMASATVQITTNYSNGEDVLALPATYLGITGSWDASTGKLTLSGAQFPVNYQGALRTVTYANSSSAPTTGNRVVTFKVNDGTVDSAGSTKTITITAVDSSPVVTCSGGSTAVTAGDPATVIDGSVTCTDSDSSNFVSGTVSITANKVSGEDVLSFSTQNGISGSYNSASGVMTLSGTASKANWQTALRTVKYNNTNTINPSILTRTITFKVNDGTSDSNASTKSVTVAAPAVARSTGMQSIAFAQKSGSGLIIHAYLEAAGSPATGKAYNTSGLVIALIKPGDSAPKVFTQAGATIEDITTLGTFAAPATNKIRFKKISDTNMPGLYELHLAAADMPSSGSVAGMILQIHPGDGTNYGLHQIVLTSLDLQGTAGYNLTAAFDGTGYAGGTIKQQVNAVSLLGTAINAAAPANFNAFFDGSTGYTGGSILLGANVAKWNGDDLDFSSIPGCPSVNVRYANHSEVPTETTDGYLAVNLARVAGTSVDAYAIQSVYYARIGYERDDANSHDEYTVTWYKNGVPVAVTGTPQIQAIKRSDGTNHFAATNMTQIGSTLHWKFSTANQLTRGLAGIIVATAMIDGSLRTFSEVVGRDSSV